MTTNALCTLDEPRAKIAAGGRLLLAGDEALLRKLPHGDWIGGTIPYFMAAQGGLHTADKIFVTELPAKATVKSIRLYGVDELPSIPGDVAENGFSVIIIPATSEVHQVYAKDAGSYPGLFGAPIVGWISGVALEDLGKVSPLVFNGLTGEASPAVRLKVDAMHSASKHKRDLPRIGTKPGA